MTDTLEFKAYMVRNDLTIADLAETLNISTQTLSKKINNHVEFKGSEIKKLSKALNLSDAERNKIFFGNDVD